MAKRLDHTEVGHGRNFLETTSQHVEARRNVLVDKNNQIGLLGLNVPLINPTRNVARKENKTAPLSLLPYTYGFQPTSA